MPGARPLRHRLSIKSIVSKFIREAASREGDGDARGGLPGDVASRSDGWARHHRGVLLQPLHRGDLGEIVGQRQVADLGVVDLRHATLDPAGATIAVNALFGGGNLLVPENWNVETRVAGIGGIGDARPKRDRSPDAPTLRVEGVAIFGGWGITSESQDERGDEVLAPV